MDVFLMIKRHRTTIFADARENTTIRELKRIIQGILKIAPDDQMLWDPTGSVSFSDDKTLSEYNITGQNAKAHAPFTIGLTLRDEGGDFEALAIAELSNPPDLPEVMRQDTSLSDN